MDILKIKRFAGLVMFMCMLACGLASCSSEDEPESAAVTPQIIFIFSPGGLGDMSYNDCILEGVQNFKKSHPDVDIFMYSPSTVEEVERIFTDWLKRPGSDIPVVFALASSDYESLVDKWLPEYGLTPNKRILLFESLRHYENPQVHTFQISMYGASLLAGVTARACDKGKGSLVLLGSSTDVPIASASDGFVAGYGSHCDVEYLADDWTGYVMATQAYRKMDEWSKKYGFIFPVAGGSNAGIYRYSREFDDCPYLAGMDVDQSGFSDRITGSVVKNFGLLIHEYFTQWLAEGTMPVYEIYGLESGYVDWVPAPAYRETFREILDGARDEAVAKEKEYYGV